MIEVVEGKRGKTWRDLIDNLSTIPAGISAHGEAPNGLGMEVEHYPDGRFRYRIGFNEWSEFHSREKGIEDLKINFLKTQPA